MVGRPASNDAIEAPVAPDETKIVGALLTSGGVRCEEFCRPLVLQAGSPVPFPGVSEPVAESEDSTCWTIAGISACVRAVLLLDATAGSEREALLLENTDGSEGSPWLITLALLFAGALPFPRRRGIDLCNQRIKLQNLATANEDWIGFLSLVADR